MARSALVVPMFLVCLTKIVACGSPHAPQQNEDTDGTDTRPGTVMAQGGCTTEGETLPCHRLIEEHEGIVTCGYGTQTCVDGAWTACGDDATSMFENGKSKAVFPNSIRLSPSSASAAGTILVPEPDVVRIASNAQARILPSTGMLAAPEGIERGALPFENAIVSALAKEGAP
jgi:hypothetical protein